MSYVASAPQGASSEDLQVFIRSLQGKSSVLVVNPDDKVKQVKERIFDLQGIPPDQQRLVFAARQLEDKKTLREHGVCAGGNIHLLLRLAGGMQIFVRDFVNPTITIDVEPSDTVAEIKEKIEDKTRMAARFQRLQFAGRYLENDRPLSDYNIQKESTLHLKIDFRAFESASSPSEAPLSAPDMQVFIKTLTSRTITIDTNPDETVAMLKRKIEIKEGIPVDQQKFTFETKSVGGNPSSDRCALKDYGIREHSTLFLLLKMKGG